MIKKILGLGLLCFGFINFCSADGGVYEIGLNSFNSKLNNDYGITALKGGSFITNYLGNSKGLFGLDTSYLVWWDLDGLLYGYYSGVTSVYQGNFSSYMLCDELTSSNSSLNLSNCNNYTISGNVGNDLKLVFSNFFSQVFQGDYFGYNYRSGPSITLCWSSRSFGKTMCFIRNTDYPFYNSKSYNGLTFFNFQTSLIGKSPGQVGYGNDNYNPGEIENVTGDIYEVPADIDRYIEYYESKYGWDESVCYVGTDDLSGAYGKPGLSFQYGSGATMFSLYHTIYGTFGQNRIKNVGKFLNCWLINYNQWWDTISDERSYLCSDNGPEINISLSYDVSENPFKNNRAAIYFLIDNLYNHQYRLDTFSPMFESSMGDEFAFYCAAKLNYENYKNGTLDFSELEDQVDPILKDIIGDWNNRNLGSQYGFSVPNMSGNDNIWGNLIQTGSGVPDDLNPSGLFKQFYDRINNLLQNFSPKTVIGFIPLWILYPMLFLILFRILRH